QTGYGMCLKCVDHCPEQAKDNFHQRIKELGGKVIGEYKESRVPVECICEKGHKCHPRPSGIKSGQGMCLKCVNLCSEQSKDNFYHNIKELGGKIIGVYVNSCIHVECECSEGHKCYPTPSSIQQGHILCPICSKKG